MAGVRTEHLRFARSIAEAAEVELVAGREAADRRVEGRQVVERQIAGAGEQEPCPAATVPEMFAVPLEMVRPPDILPFANSVSVPPLSVAESQFRPRTRLASRPY